MPASACAVQGRLVVLHHGALISWVVRHFYLLRYVQSAQHNAWQPCLLRYSISTQLLLRNHPQRRGESIALAASLWVKGEDYPACLFQLAEIYEAMVWE